MGTLKIKRAYIDAGPEDGYRILVDRLWPRGVTKEAAAVDEWAKEITPSTELRKWFGHREENFDKFREQYLVELDANPKAFAFAKHCEELLTNGNVTLVYGARSTTCNHALILRDWILEHP